MPPCFAISSTLRRTSAGNSPPACSTKRRGGVGGPFAYLATVEIYAADPRLRRERDELGMHVAQLATAQSVTFLGEHDDATTFGRLVRQRR
ncbi:MAG: hypothetical protein QM811_21600 [Pirellulales bacterium]